ncbi:ABC transporter ATP-binding protein [Pediococcus claussenii]|uniref:Multidrug resistance ABC transporter ATP-binding and permease protein n=2 Tax=Pediococcus claussenii TaxID=187452 RepID=G8PDD7_PEDCP|nr:ABC transporter ATP-binding protein [Pediococcus claussenii]ACR82886.1 beer spoilage-related B [Pediococcus claussenii]AEV95272.1 ABC transporter [Pediococcus claussenii ATCC BAA-344]ANZ68808.1 multidrug ABC transporter ATP-binding protein [Pediococcus claussenii]ANZ70624.1 multidrug ABC transporter ATP-binding protein [Pediococcus claussenii]KRN19546.1 hypothetical protein IV79_GL001263 [Pediococcus claussenii]
MKKEVTLLSMFRYVFQTVLQKKRLLFLNIAALIIITALQFVMPQFTQYIIDKIIPDKSMTKLFYSVALMILAAVLLGVFNYFSTYYMSIMSQNSILTLRENLFRHILSLDSAYFESSKTGDLMVRLTSDINNLQSLISANMLSIIGNFFTFVGVLVFIIIVNWQMALAVSITFPLMFFIYRIFRTRIRTAFRNARVSQADMSNQMQNTLTQIQLIKSFTNEKAESKKFDQFADQNRQYMIEASRNQAIFSPSIDFVNYLGTAIILLLGSYFVIKGQLLVGQMVAYISYVAMLQSPIRSFTQLLNQIQQSLISYGRIIDVIGVQPKIIDSPDAENFPQIKQGIKLDDISFSYSTDNVNFNDGSNALNNVTFNIPYGKTTALVGHSGAGKTTITKLLTRFYEVTSGNIFFDNIPIKDIKIKSLRDNIAIVSQDVDIIDGTIRENIMYGESDISDKNIHEAAQMANIDDYIVKLPDGLDTQVGERGIKLSGGQKQRISIARALLKDAQVIILDEATAALDNESEKAIQHALNNLLTNRTSLVIAHRLSTIHNADNIIVMDQGRVVESGTHENLLKQNSYYKKLYDAQFE